MPAAARTSNRVSEHSENRYSSRRFRSHLRNPGLASDCLTKGVGQNGEGTDVTSRITAIVLIAQLFASSSFAGSRVEFSAGKAHSLFVFMEGLTGNPHRPRHLKKTFDESKFNNAESQTRIQAFRDLDSAFGRHFEFESLPRERNNGVSVEVLVTIQSAFAKDLKDFRQRILGLMPYDKLTTLIDTLAYFEPIYDELIWQPNQKDLNQVVAEFKTKSDKWELDDMFDRALTFYRSGWPLEQLFHVILYPIPRGADTSNGQSFGAFESVGVIIGDKSTEREFGVVFHEICHSLYDAESAEFQQTLSNWFMNHPSPYARVAYSWLNEALATAIGNGWAYAKAKGELNQGEWFHHEKINGFAHALYPKVAEYLNSRKPIDEDFVNFAVQAFEKTFPQAISEYETIMSNLVLLSDGSVGSSRDLKRALQSQFQIPSIDSASPIDHAESKNDIRNKPSATIFLIATRNNRKQIEAIDDVLPGIEKIVKSAAKEGDHFGVFDFDSRKVMLLLVEDPATVSKVIKWMAATVRPEKTNEFVPPEGDSIK